MFSTSNALENHIQSKKHKEVISGKDKKKGKSKQKKYNVTNHQATATQGKSVEVTEEKADEPMSEDGKKTLHTIHCSLIIF